jgi:hypothetical protein
MVQMIQSSVLRTEFAWYLPHTLHLPLQADTGELFLLQYLLEGSSMWASGLLVQKNVLQTLSTTLCAFCLDSLHLDISMV